MQAVVLPCTLVEPEGPWFGPFHVQSPPTPAWFSPPLDLLRSTCCVPAVPSGKTGPLQSAGPGQPHVHLHGRVRFWPQVSTAWHVRSRAKKGCAYSRSIARAIPWLGYLIGDCRVGVWLGLSWDQILFSAFLCIRRPRCRGEDTRGLRGEGGCCWNSYFTQVAIGSRCVRPLRWSRSGACDRWVHRWAKYGHPGLPTLGITSTQRVELTYSTLKPAMTVPGGVTLPLGTPISISRPSRCLTLAVKPERQSLRDMWVLVCRS